MEPAAARGLDAGYYHTCAIVLDAAVRCWGYGGDGQLGYGNTDSIGDDETPASAGPVNLGPGRTATAVSAGDYHTCALLDDGSVRCWGFGANGRLGYPNTDSIGIRQDPGAVGPVDLGPGRTATAISAGGAHTCAVLDDRSVRCWGFNGTGQLGYGNMENIGDTETPGSVGPVNLGPGRTATAISAGARYTCALLDNASVRCWGYGGDGQLGYGSTDDIGDTETPGSVGPVNLGPGRTATAISAGARHACARLDDATVRCWGYGSNGRLGYATTANVGDTPAQTPDKAGPVDLGPGRSALAVSAGGAHTCARLDDATVRCWGFGGDGRLGYGNPNNVGDLQTPGSVGPVELGAGRTALAIAAGQSHTCARLDDTTVRCWGYGANGRLGYCNANTVGDIRLPSSVGPVNLQPGDGGARCSDGADMPPGAGAVPANAGEDAGLAPIPAVGDSRSTVDPFAVEALRRQGLRACVAQARRLRTPGQRRRSRKGCLRRYGRRPGRIARVDARALSRTRVLLSFSAPGSDGPNPPAARAYLVRQSRRAPRRARDRLVAQALCQGRCSLAVSAVGTRINLMITDLQPHSTYYYTVAARDNVSNRLAPTSPPVRVRTR